MDKHRIFHGNIHALNGDFPSLDHHEVSIFPGELSICPIEINAFSPLLSVQEIHRMELRLEQLKRRQAAGLKMGYSFTNVH